VEIGVYTFADISPDAKAPGAVGPGVRLRQLLEEIELADRVGLDVFGVGEHHRPDYAVSAPPIALAAAAERTKKIKLTSAVTVLSSDDPVRVYQQFTTIDLLSGGRAEIMVGRGSFIESFPLFGYDLNDYDELFSEKLDLLLKIRDGGAVTWEGHHRAPLRDQVIYPKPDRSLPIWVAVGGNPPSVVRAGSFGLPMALAIIGGIPERFAPLVELYRESARRSGHNAGALPVGINSHGFVADTSKDAADIFFPSYAEVMSRIGQERGWPPTTRQQFEAARVLRGALLVGSPEEVTEKILFQHKIFGHRRFLMQMSLGTMPHDKVLRSIELLGTKVAPAVRTEIAKRDRESTAAAMTAG
jgi:probable LLM family oxidoreductase